MTAAPDVYRRRRAVALGLLGVLIVLIGIVLRSCGGAGENAGAARTAPQSALPQLPGGGRQIFPARRVVAFYGAPQARSLGVLGIGTPDHAAAKLKRAARAYARGSKPVLPAMELLATIATSGPGDDGLNRTHQPPATIDRYLAAARKVHALLVLDIQPGHGDFLSEAQRLEPWLLQPDVGIALDPEWHVGPGQIPGQTIGSVTAAEVNAVETYVSDLVGKHELPQKLFVLHQFTNGMIKDKDQVQQRPGLAVTMNVDGVGDRANKVEKYDAFTSQTARFHNGFKLFYQEDTGLMSHGEVLALKPPPDLIVYE